jgi:hypothetical protein
MEPERFDDVESTILEVYEPPGRGPLRRRVALALTLMLVVTGTTAAGASALTGGDAAKPPPAMRNVDDMLFAPTGHPCHAGQGAAHHPASAAGPRY